MEHAFLHALMHEAPLGVALIDAEGRFLAVNDVLAGINGRPSSEHIGRLLEEVVPGIADQARALLAEVLMGNAVSREISGETAREPGVVGHWVEQWFPVREGDRIIGAGVTIVEITEQRRAEEAVAAVRARVEAEARDRVDRLEFAAHEIANPLTALVGGIAILQRRLAGQPTYERDLPLLTDLTREAGEVRAAFRFFLDLERALDGLAVQAVDLEVLTREVIEEVRHRDPVLRITSNLVGVRVQLDPAAYRHILRNLLGNAAKHGGADVRVRCGVEEGLGGCPFVEVADDGPGIPVEERAHVFERGFRGQRAEGSPGRGVGLYLASRLAEALGARLLVVGTGEQGATFRLELPRVVPGAEDAYRPVAVSRVAGAA